MDCRRLISRAISHGNRRFAAAVVIGYHFMLRMGSEYCNVDMSQISVNEKHDTRIVLRRRKNKPEGSVLIRPCCCNKFPDFCPHKAVDWLKSSVNKGDSLYSSYANFLADLRLYAKLEGLEGAIYFGSHGFRRGAAVDLASLPDMTVEKLMLAGEWIADAWLQYVKTAEVKVTAVADALNAYDSDDEV